MRAALTVLVLAGGILIAGCEGSKSSPTSPDAPPPGLVTIVAVSDAIDVTTGGTGTFNWAGQSLTLPAGGPYANLRFNWYTFQKAPAAFGRLYILSQEYLGLPGDLNTGTPGFLARSDEADAGHYVFPAGVSLDGGRQYWFYSDTQGSFAGSFDTDIYPGGDLYVSGHPTAVFRKAHASGRMVNGVYVPPPPGVFLDANFRLQGSAGR